MSDRPEPRYLLNINPGGMDVLHRNPREECNTDDASHVQAIDPDTADALLSMGEAMPCEHCLASDPT